MTRFGMRVCRGLLAIAAVLLGGGELVAQQKGPPEALIRNAFREILASVDTNRDGRLAMTECMAISRDKKKIEKDCRYWDANSDGIITEDEYVQQVKRLMR